MEGNIPLSSYTMTTAVTRQQRPWITSPLMFFGQCIGMKKGKWGHLSSDQKYCTILTWLSAHGQIIEPTSPFQFKWKKKLQGAIFTQLCELCCPDVVCQPSRINITLNYYPLPPAGSVFLQIGSLQVLLAIFIVIAVVSFWILNTCFLSVKSCHVKEAHAQDITITIFSSEILLQESELKVKYKLTCSQWKVQSVLMRQLSF